jgi:hypothetical protein
MDEVVLYPDHYRGLVGPYYFEDRVATIHSLPELDPNETPARRREFQHRLQDILAGQKRTWLLCFLDQDESRDRNLAPALALARKVVRGNWCIVTDIPYVSFTRILNKPYTGAHVMLLQPSTAGKQLAALELGV